MENKKECAKTNCGRFPMCKYQHKCIYGYGTEDYWIKRDIQMHLKSKKGEKFDFGRIE